MSSKSKVYFFFDNVNIAIRNRKKIKAVLETLCKQQKRDLVSLNYIFCSDKSLLTINRKYLQHNYYTDIVTFELSENKRQIIGEVYISIDRVKDNARNYKVSTQAELLRVIFHGALHLCGYNDKSQKEKLQMPKK